MQCLKALRVHIAVNVSATLQGSRFAILHGDGPRPTFSVYAMRQDLKSSVRGVSLVGSQPSKQANCMFWSPQGKYMVLAGLKVRGAAFLKGQASSHAACMSRDIVLAGLKLQRGLCL